MDIPNISPDQLLARVGALTLANEYYIQRIKELEEALTNLLNSSTPEERVRESEQ